MPRAILFILILILFLHYTEKYSSISIKSVKIIDDKLYATLINNGFLKSSIKHLYILNMDGEVVSILNVSEVLDVGEVKNISISLPLIPVNNTYILTTSIYMEGILFNYTFHGPALSLIVIVDSDKMFRNITYFLNKMNISYISAIYLRNRGLKYDTVIPSTSIFLTKVPKTLAEMEVKYLLNIWKTDKIFLPYYDLDSNILKILENKGIKYVFLNGDNNTNIYRYNNTFILTGVDYRKINLTKIIGEKRSTIITVSLKDIEYKGFLKFIEKICLFKNFGKIRVVGLNKFIEENIGKSISIEDINVSVFKPISNDLWKYYYCLLDEAVQHLQKVGDKYCIKLLDTINTSVFWTGDYNTCLRKIEELEKILVELRYIDREYACYYLTNIDVKKLLDRRFKIILIEFESLSQSDVRQIKNSCKLLLGYINFGHAENWRDYWSKIRDEDWIHGRTKYRGEYFIEFWRNQWHKIVLEKIFKAYKMGFNGICLDNIDACIVLSKLKPPWIKGLNLSELMVKSIQNISNIVREKCGRDFKIYINIGSAYRLLKDDRFLKAIDGVLREGLWFTARGEAEEVTKYLKHARWKCKTIIVSDFIKNRNDAEKFCKLCWSNGFIPVPQPKWVSDYSEPPPRKWTSH